MTQPLPCQPDDELRWVIAQHEAGHAVMRWLRGRCATELRIGPEGGWCGGDGRRCRAEDALLIALAGIATECGYGLASVDLSASRSADLDYARALLRDHRLLLLHGNAQGNVSFESIDRALTRHFERACALLFPDLELVETVADRLERAGTLSARTVSALCREHARRVLRKETPTMST